MIPNFQKTILENMNSTSLNSIGFVPQLKRQFILTMSSNSLEVLL